MKYSEFLKIVNEKKNIKKNNIKKNISDLEAVKQDGWALEYVRKQTPKICLEAVKENGWALQYVRKQTPEICLEAVKGNEYALRYVGKDIFEKEN